MSGKEDLSNHCMTIKLRMLKYIFIPKYIFNNAFCVNILKQGDYVFCPAVLFTLNIQLGKSADRATNIL